MLGLNLRSFYMSVNKKTSEEEAMDQHEDPLLSGNYS